LRRYIGVQEGVDSQLARGKIWRRIKGRPEAGIRIVRRGILQASVIIHQVSGRTWRERLCIPPSCRPSNTLVAICRDMAWTDGCRGGFLALATFSGPRAFFSGMSLAQTTETALFLPQYFEATIQVIVLAALVSEMVL
jgi:hypothetical protein